MKMPIPSTNPPPQLTSLPGYWLPEKLRETLAGQLQHETYFLKGGRLVEAPAPGSVAIQWPILENQQWAWLLEGLQKMRLLDTRQFLARWQAALASCQEQIAAKLIDFLPALSAATGYTPEMILRGYASVSLSQVSSLAGSLDFNPNLASASQWQPLPGLSGCVRFFPRGPAASFANRLRPSRPFYRPAPPTDLALGFAAGNVPGTGFLIALLGGLANAAHPHLPAPAVIVRSSRHEPLFLPWLLSLIEAVDPELTAATAVLGWDYEALDLQRGLIGSAGLLLAAAGDDTLAAIESVRRSVAPAVRFHRHGHKASFSAISREYAASEEIARLGALDSALWDQNGCLSARLHFVEGDAEAYAQHLAEALRQASIDLPRGATPGRLTHRAFDIFHNLENSGRVKVFSSYEDGFVVVLDERPWESVLFRRTTNACQGRTAVVRPVASLEQVPGWLRLLPPENLQTMGLACEEKRTQPLAEALGAAGVTAVRRLGEAAFPQLAYSWDGYIPMDTAYLRPEGHWTGIEP